MKKFLALFLVLPAFAASSQQGGSLQQHFQVGQQMRQAWDARKAAKEDARQAEEDERAPAKRLTAPAPAPAPASNPREPTMAKNPLLTAYDKMLASKEGLAPAAGALDRIRAGIPAAAAAISAPIIRAGELIRADHARQAEEDERLRLAYTTPSLILISRNGLPDIKLSDVAANDCTSSFKAAFTLDARGKIVAGCASLGPTKLHVIWHSYGEQTYQLSEWEAKQPLDSDHAPLGGQ